MNREYVLLLAGLVCWAAVTLICFWGPLARKILLAGLTVLVAVAVGSMLGAGLTG